MVTAVRWLVVGLLGIHGAIHLLGAAKGFGLAEVERLKQPIGTVAGVGWLLAALLVITAAAMVAAGSPTWWWLVAVCGAVVSQIVIVTSWNDAKAGTVFNVLLLVTAAFGFASLGPVSLHAAHAERTDEVLSGAPVPGPVVHEEDLEDLPALVATYVRRSGAVGKPRVTAFSADVSGRIRNREDDPWMSFTGRQLNVFGPRPQRLFFIRATRAGLPVTVFHDYRAGTARMRGRLAGLIPLFDATGPEMDRSETVTVLNDLVVFAPAAIVDAPIRWTPIDDTHVRATYAVGGQTVSAELVFDDRGDLVDFVSDDRLRASEDGSEFTPLRWSTPLSAYRESDGVRRVTGGRGMWHEADEAYAYVDFVVSGVVDNP